MKCFFVRESSRSRAGTGFTDCVQIKPFHNASMGNFILSEAAITEDGTNIEVSIQKDAKRKNSKRKSENELRQSRPEMVCHETHQEH